MAELTILQVVPRLDTGGSEQATVEIAEALTRAGAKALVATAGGRMANAVTQAGGEIVTLPVASKNPFTMLANATRLESLIKERDVALVHARSPVGRGRGAPCLPRAGPGVPSSPPIMAPMERLAR